MVSTLVGLELERSRSPEWATEEAAGDFVQALFDRKITDRGDIEARAAELGSDLSSGTGVVIARAVPHVAQTGVAIPSAGDRTARGEGGERRCPCGRGGIRKGGGRGGGGGAGRRRRAPRPRVGCARELEEGLSGFSISVARSRLAVDPADVYRAGRRRCSPRTSARPRGRGYSPSRRPAPTGCCCPR